MATSNNTIKTRVQLKSDIEKNWNKLEAKNGNPGFVPLRGELIIYSADETHAFSRLKVGDGTTNVVELPFIDAGTIGGESVEIVKSNSKINFPSPGSPDKLYIDLSTNKLYHYENASGYTELVNISVQKETIQSVTSWFRGVLTTASIQNNTLKVTNGQLPELYLENVTVVTDIE